MISISEAALDLVFGEGCETNPEARARSSERTFSLIDDMLYEGSYGSGAEIFSALKALRTFGFSTLVMTSYYGSQPLSYGPEVIATILLRQRMQKGYTLRQLAQKTKLIMLDVEKTEDPHTTKEPFLVRKVCVALGIDPNSLLTPMLNR